MAKHTIYEFLDSKGKLHYVKSNFDMNTTACMYSFTIKHRLLSAYECEHKVADSNINCIITKS